MLEIISNMSLIRFQQMRENPQSSAQSITVTHTYIAEKENKIIKEETPYE